MDNRDSRGHGSASDQQSDSLFEALVAEAAACGELAADAMRQYHLLLASDPSSRALFARLRCLRAAVNFKHKQIRLLQRAGLLPRLRRRRRPNSR
jgi:hypothetical protein